MIESVVKTFALLLVLGSTCCIQSVTATPVYALLWKFPPTPTLTTVDTCGYTFQTVRDRVYPDFVLEVMAETNLTLDEINRLDPDWNTTSRRRLSSSEKQVEQGKQGQRLLQRKSRCNFNLCDDSTYIIRLSGCTSWCQRAQRRLGELQSQQVQVQGQTKRRLDDEDDDDDDDDEDDSSCGTGSYGNILWNKPGHDTANLVYQEFELLPLNNTCRSSLLSLTYTIKYVDTAVLEECDD